MNIIWGIIAVIVSFFFVGFVYWFWGLISSLLMSAAMGMGYGIGKFIGITPRSQSQVNSWLIINYILQLGIEWGLSIWALTLAITWFFPNSVISKINYCASAVWFIALAFDLLCLFIIGLMYGKVEKMLQKGKSPYGSIREYK